MYSHIALEPLADTETAIDVTGTSQPFIHNPDITYNHYLYHTSYAQCVCSTHAALHVNVSQPLSDPTLL